MDGSRAVKEIRGPGWVTRVCWCLGWPCFNKHLERPRAPKHSPFKQMCSLNSCTHTHDCCVCVCVSADPPRVSHRCISAPSACFSGPARRPGPRFTGLTQESIAGCLWRPGRSLSEIFHYSSQLPARGGARPISRAATCVPA